MQDNLRLQFKSVENVTGLMNTCSYLNNWSPMVYMIDCPFHELG